MNRNFVKAAALHLSSTPLHNLMYAWPQSYNPDFSLGCINKWHHIMNTAEARTESKNKNLSAVCGRDRKVLGWEKKLWRQKKNKMNQIQEIWQRWQLKPHRHFAEVLPQLQMMQLSRTSYQGHENY